MARKNWDTTFKGGSPIQDPDPITDSQPDNTVDVDDIIPSHTATLREKINAAVKLLGDSANNPSGSVRSVLNALGVSRLRTTSGGGTALPVGAIADGEFLKRVGAALVGAPAGELITHIDLDFRTLANQNLKTGGDGNKTIGGFTFYADNTGVATILDILNGTGLRIHPDATNTNFASSRTSPVVGIKLPDVISGLNMTNKAFVRAWVMFSHVNLDADFEIAALAFERKEPTFALATWMSWQLSRYHQDQARFMASRNVGASNVTAINQTDNLADDIMMVKFYGPGHVETYTGVSSGGDFPDESTLRLRHSMQSLITNSVETMSRMLSSELAVAMAAAPNNTSGTFQVTYQRLKIESK